jgi:AraC-like DNA-binding protein
MSDFVGKRSDAAVSIPVSMPGQYAAYPDLGLSDVQIFGHDPQVIDVVRPTGLRAGFHATVQDSGSGLCHAGEQWAPARWLIRRHTHPVWEIYLQMHGLSRWRADGQFFSLQPGHLFAVGPGVVHQMADRPAGNHHFYFAAIDLGVVLQRHAGLAARWQNVPSVLHRGQAHTLAGPFADLTRELTSRYELADQGLALAVDRVVLEVTRLLVPQNPLPLNGIHPAVLRVRELLDRDYARNWSLRELAEDVGLAATYLAALFTAEVGMPPHRYLTERRIEQAGRLLRTSELPITAIGVDVGFSSGQHFARVFRQVTGRTPSTYRRIHN